LNPRFIGEGNKEHKKAVLESGKIGDAIGKKKGSTYAEKGMFRGRLGKKGPNYPIKSEERRDGNLTELARIKRLKHGKEKEETPKKKRPQDSRKGEREVIRDHNPSNLV